MDDDSLLITRIPDTLRKQVVDRIRTAICENRFPQGARLVERQLCTLLGVSRTSVREALRQLEAEGFVVSGPRQGPAVASLDRDTVRGIYEVRAALEALAGKLFVERATDAHRTALAAAFAALAAAHREAVPGVALERTVGFYDAIFAGAQNETIVTTIRPLSGRIYLLRARSMSVKGRRVVSFTEMKAINRALMGRDPAKAWDACWNHVMQAASYALRTFGDGEAEAADAGPDPELARTG